jgi:hypothetical protein
LLDQLVYGVCSLVANTSECPFTRFAALVLLSKLATRFSDLTLETEAAQEEEEDEDTTICFLEKYATTLLPTLLLSLSSDDFNQSPIQAMAARTVNELFSNSNKHPSEECLGYVLDPILVCLKSFIDSKQQSTANLSSPDLWCLQAVTSACGSIALASGSAFMNYFDYFIEWVLKVCEMEFINGQLTIHSAFSELVGTSLLTGGSMCEALLHPPSTVLPRIMRAVFRVIATAFDDQVLNICVCDYSFCHFIVFFFLFFFFSF